MTFGLQPLTLLPYDLRHLSEWDGTGCEREEKPTKTDWPWRLKTRERESDFDEERLKELIFVGSAAADT